LDLLNDDLLRHGNGALEFFKLINQLRFEHISLEGSMQWIVDTLQFRCRGQNKANLDLLDLNEKQRENQIHSHVIIDGLVQTFDKIKNSS